MSDAFRGRGGIIDDLTKRLKNGHLLYTDIAGTRSPTEYGSKKGSTIVAENLNENFGKWEEKPADRSKGRLK